MKSEVWWCVLVLLGVSGVDTDGESVSVMEGDSVTLYTDVKTNQHETIKFYFYDIQVVEINKGQIKICTYECKKIFGNRLKLDHQTGSLTITNTRTTDSGLYHLEIINSGSHSEKTFNVTINGVSAPEDHQKKRNPVKEGESDSGLPPAAVAGICVAGVLVAAAAAAGVIYYRKRPQPVVTGTRTQHSDQVKGVAYSSVKHADNGSVPAANGRLHNGHESAATN